MLAPISTVIQFSPFDRTFTKPMPGIRPGDLMNAPAADAFVGVELQNALAKCVQADTGQQLNVRAQARRADGLDAAFAAGAHIEGVADHASRKMRRL